MIKVNNFNIVFSQLINIIFPIMTIPLLINKIGITGYGKYNYINLIATLLCSIIDYNFFTTGVLYIRSNKNLVTLIARCLISLFISLFFLCCSPFLSSEIKTDSFYIIIYILSWGLNSTYALIALEQGSKIFLSNALSKIVFFIGVAFFVFNYHEAFIFLCLSNFVLSIITTFFYIKSVRKVSWPSYRDMIGYFNHDLWSVGVQIGGFLTGNLHLFLGKYFLGELDYGILSLFDRIFRSITSVFSSFSNSLLTRFYNIKTHSLSRQIYYFSLLISIPYTISVILLPLAFQIFRLRFDNYIISYNFLFFIFFCWGLLAINASLVGINILQVSGKSNFYSLAYLISFIVELLISYIFRDSYDLKKASLFMLINEIVIFLLVIIKSRRLI